MPGRRRLVRYLQRFRERKLEYDLTGRVCHFKHSGEQAGIFALVLKNLPDGCSRYAPGMIRIAQVFAFRIRNKRFADPRVEEIAWHDRNLGPSRQTHKGGLHFCAAISVDLIQICGA